MKEQLKHLLKKMPVLYRFVEKGYTYTLLRFQYLKYLLVGTKVMEKEWATRHLREREKDGCSKENTDWIRSYWDSLDHPHRPFLIEKISKFNPSSILEIGCNCGPNLHLLAKKFPDAKIIGIDINPVAVQKGNEWLVEEGISNITLLEGKADELGQFQDRSFDVVFTDAVLIYIGPDKIKEVIAEMLRVSRRALILLEWHCFNSKSNHLGVYVGVWMRNYVTLLDEFVPENKIKVIKTPEELWSNENWQMYGGVIEVVMR